MFYVLDDNNNKIEAFDKEGVLAALEEAIANGTLESLVADSAFVTKLKCCITGGTTKMAFVTSAQYNELEAGGALEKGVAYFIIDDTTIDDLEEKLALIEEKVSIIPARRVLIAGGRTDPICTFTSSGGVHTKRIFYVDGKIDGRIFEIHINGIVYTVSFVGHDRWKSFLLIDDFDGETLVADCFRISGGEYNGASTDVNMMVRNYRSTTSTLNVWAVYEIMG